ncbi:DUF47 family protein [Actinomadura fulvescens]|uniref:DUF47 domain-containing protein n=1 Tax=Actinomadura fulvescens TaxID=46160 RepID=A0ABN3PNP1_9ACTN
MRYLRRLSGIVRGRMDTALADALGGQLRATLDGARLALAMIHGTTDPAAAHDRIREIEHRGDACRARLIGELGDAVITPLDREDLFRLSRSIDDVLDTLRDFIRESHLYRVSDQSRFGPILTQVLTSVESLQETAGHLADRPTRATRSAMPVRKAAGTIRRLCQYENAQVLTGALTIESMKRQALIRRLEMVGRHIGEAADAIADGAMKRWH